MGTLPQEVLSVLPSDCGQQLELANKIIAHAFSSRVRRQESSNRAQAWSGQLSSMRRTVVTQVGLAGS